MNIASVVCGVDTRVLVEILVDSIVFALQFVKSARINGGVVGGEGVTRALQ